MRSSLILSLVLPLGLASPGESAGLAPLVKPRGISQIIPGKYIVKLRDDDVASTSLDEVIGLVTVTADRVYKGAFNGFAAQLDGTALKSLRSHPSVEYVEHDAVVNVAAYVDQPGAPWGLARISSRTPGATTYVYDESAGAGACAYILDTGIDASHPEYSGRATQVANFAGGDDADGNGHGTHVAGIIGGVTYGVAKNVTLLGVKVLSDSGAGSTSGIISGIDFVAEDASTRDCPSGAVINMSIGGSFSTAMNSAAASLVSAGHFVVAAAGNSASDAGNYSPGSEPTACTIGGSDQSDSVMSTSNYGSAIDLYAPGAQIPSAWPDGGEQTLSGTSMAAAHVTGLGAYLATLEGVKPSGLCARIQELATQDALSGVPAGTANLLAFNGNPDEL